MPAGMSVLLVGGEVGSAVPSPLPGSAAAGDARRTGTPLGARPPFPWRRAICPRRRRRPWRRAWWTRGGGCWRRGPRPPTCTGAGADAQGSAGSSQTQPGASPDAELRRRPGGKPPHQRWGPGGLGREPCRPGPQRLRQGRLQRRALHRHRGGRTCEDQGAGPGGRAARCIVEYADGDGVRRAAYWAGDAGDVSLRSPAPATRRRAGSSRVVFALGGDAFKLLSAAWPTRIYTAVSRSRDTLTLVREKGAMR